MIWIFLGLCFIGIVLCVMVKRKLVKPEIPFIYCLLGTIICSFMCMVEFNNPVISFEWYGYLVIIFIIEACYLYRYF